MGVDAGVADQSNLALRHDLLDRALAAKEEEAREGRRHTYAAIGGEPEIAHHGGGREAFGLAKHLAFQISDIAPDQRFIHVFDSGIDQGHVLDGGDARTCEQGGDLFAIGFALGRADTNEEAMIRSPMRRPAVVNLQHDDPDAAVVRDLVDSREDRRLDLIAADVDELFFDLLGIVQALNPALVIYAEDDY